MEMMNQSWEDLGECKGPGVGTSLVCLGSCQKVAVTGERVG